VCVKEVMCSLSLIPVLASVPVQSARSAIPVLQCSQRLDTTRQCAIPAKRGKEEGGFALPGRVQVACDLSSFSTRVSADGPGAELLSRESSILRAVSNCSSTALLGQWEQSSICRRAQ
jgi:hypothetical protein